MPKKPHVGFSNQEKCLGMLQGRVPGAVVPGCWLQGLVAAEDLQDFAQLLQVGSFQVQMVMSKFRGNCCLRKPLLPSVYLGSSSIRQE